jgi:hypothetical protein
MIITRPTVAEERWLELASRYAALRTAIERTGNGGNWKTTSALGRVLGFLLGLLATSLLGGTLALFPAPLLIGGMLLVVAAEWLVAMRRVFRSGIEEAIYLCGATGIVVQLLIWSHGNNAGLGIACVAMAVLLVGWRLLNPLFTTLAVAACSLAFALAGEGLFSGNEHTLVAAIFCGAVWVVALLGGGRTWRRPAHDGMCDGLIVVMPLLCYGWYTAHGWYGGASRAWSSLLLALLLFALSVVVGARRRAHAPLIAALGSVACVAYSVHRLLAWPVHWRLIADGAVLLALAILLERRLRDRTAGITSQAIGGEPTGLELAQLAGAAHLTPVPGPAPAAGFQGQGGDFGGGGASGRF